MAYKNLFNVLVSEIKKYDEIFIGQAGNQSINSKLKLEFVFRISHSLVHRLMLYLLFFLLFQQYISLLFIGMLIVISVRGFLTNLMKVILSFFLVILIMLYVNKPWSCSAHRLYISKSLPNVICGVISQPECWMTIIYFYKPMYFWNFGKWMYQHQVILVTIVQGWHKMDLHLHKTYSNMFICFASWLLLVV